MRKLTYELVKKAFEDAKCRLLSKEYVNANTVLDCRCSCGNLWTTTYGNFSRGQRCKECGHERMRLKRQLDPKYVEKYFRDRGCELLVPYRNCDETIYYRCGACGGKHKTTFTSFQSSTYKCRQRFKEMMSKRFRLDFEEVKRLFEYRKCTLLSTSYTNAHQELFYICSCGRNAKTNYMLFRQSHGRCRVCSGTEPLTIEYVRWFFEAHRCRLLATEYQNAHVPMDYVCVCKQHGRINFSNFSTGKRCRKCMNLRRLEQEQLWEQADLTNLRDMINERRDELESQAPRKRS